MSMIVQVQIQEQVVFIDRFYTGLSNDQERQLSFPDVLHVPCKYFSKPVYLKLCVLFI